MASLSHSFAAPALLSTCFLVSKSFWSTEFWAALCPAPERQPPLSTEGSCVPVLGGLGATTPVGGRGGGGGSRTFLFQNRLPGSAASAAGWGGGGHTCASGFPGTEGCAHQEHPPHFILFLLFTDMQVVSFQGWGSHYPSQQSANRYWTKQQACLVAPDLRLAGQLTAGRQPSLLRQEPERGQQSRGRQGEWGPRPVLHRRAQHVPTVTGLRGPSSFHDPTVVHPYSIISCRRSVAGRGRAPEKNPRCGFQPKSSFAFDFESCPMVLVLGFIFS